MNHNLYKILYDNFKSNIDKICIEIPDSKKISFIDLDILSAHFASFLNDLGLKKGDRMICQIDKSLSAIGLYLACLRTGVIYTPLNTSYTHDEVEYFIQNIESRQSFKIGCLEEIALNNKWITKKNIMEAIKFYGKCQYSDYLKKLI